MERDNNELKYIKLQRTLKLLNFFNITAYVAIIVMLVMFVAVEVPYLMRKDYYDSGGAGTVVVLMCTGPMIIIGMIMTILFLVVSGFVLTSRKKFHDTIMRECKKSALLFLIIFMLPILSFIILF